MILRNKSMVTLHFLLTIRQRNRTISIYLTSGRTLTNFIVHRSNGIRNLFNANSRNLLSIRITSNRSGLLLGTSFALPNEDLRRIRVIPHRIMFTFPRTPIRR